MKRTLAIVLLIGVAAVLGLVALRKHFVDKRVAEAIEPPLSQACAVKTLERIVEGGMYPKWSKAKGLIAFNKLVEKKAFVDRIPGVYEIFTVKPDGTDLRCLTCDTTAIASKYHKAQPYWHPSGDYLIFTAQNEHTKPSKHNLDSFPGIGHNHDVWIMSSDGAKYWPITDYPDDWGAIRPSFSHNGTMVYWNEEYSIEKYPGVGSEWSMEDNRKGEEWGLWRIKLGDIDWSTGKPVVSNIRTININELYPGMRLIEGSGLTPDDTQLIFESANIHETDGSMWWGDVYLSDLEGGSLKRLTTSAKSFQGNENMEYSPDGKLIAWSHHDTDTPGKEVEIYLMHADGQRPTRLTYFNLPGHPHQRAFQKFSHTNGCGELDWGPAGKRIVFGMSNGGRLGWPHFSFSLYLLTFAGACGLAN